MTELKKLTRSQVSEHNNNSSAWVVIGNKVYNVTKFLDEHPGGCEVLLEQAGNDGTEAFEDVGHSTDAREMRETFLIGEIVDDEKKTYSYDKRQLDNSSKDASKKKDGSRVGGMTIPDMIVIPALITAIVGIIYFLFLS